MFGDWNNGGPLSVDQDGVGDFAEKPCIDCPQQRRPPYNRIKILKKGRHQFYRTIKQ